MQEKQVELCLGPQRWSRWKVAARNSPEAHLFRIFRDAKECMIAMCSMMLKDSSPHAFHAFHSVFLCTNIQSGMTLLSSSHTLHAKMEED